MHPLARTRRAVAVSSFGWGYLLSNSVAANHPTRIRIGFLGTLELVYAAACDLVYRPRRGPLPAFRYRAPYLLGDRFLLLGQAFVLRLEWSMALGLGAHEELELLL